MLQITSADSDVLTSRKQDSSKESPSGYDDPLNLD